MGSDIAGYHELGKHCILVCVCVKVQWTRSLAPFSTGRLSNTRKIIDFSLLLFFGDVCV